MGIDKFWLFEGFEVELMVLFGWSQFGDQVVDEVGEGGVGWGGAFEKGANLSVDKLHYNYRVV